jgi:hypothetical protein
MIAPLFPKNCLNAHLIIPPLSITNKYRSLQTVLCCRAYVPTGTADAIGRKRLRRSFCESQSEWIKRVLRTVSVTTSDLSIYLAVHEGENPTPKTKKQDFRKYFHARGRKKGRESKGGIKGGHCQCATAAFANK